MAISYKCLSHNSTFPAFITRFHKNDMKLQNSFITVQIRKVKRQPFVRLTYRTFETVNNGNKRHCFVAKVGSRGFCVFYEVKISVTESSSFFKT